MKFARAAKENPTLKKALEKVVLFKANVHEEAGEKLADRYNAHGIPQFFLLDKDGTALDRWHGYGLVSDWLQDYEGALSDLTPIEAKVERFKTQPTETVAAALGRIRSAEDNPKEAVRYYREAQNLASAPSSRYATEIFLNQFHGSDKSEFTLDELKASADAVFAIEPGDDLHRAVIGWSMADLANTKKDPSILKPYLARAVEAAARVDDPDVARMAREDLLVTEALLIQGDKEKALAIKKDWMPQGWAEDPEKLNDLAWWCFRNEVNLEEGERLARKGIALAKDDKEKAQILDTAAEICNLLGNCKDSVSLIAEAAKLDPDSEHYKKQLARFQELLAKQRG